MASVGTIWMQFLWDCIHHGKMVTKDDAEVKELLGNYIYIERPQDIGAPLNERVSTPERFLELLEKGAYDIEGYPFKTEALYDYVTSLNDDKHIFCSDMEEFKALFKDSPCDDIAPIPTCSPDDQEAFFNTPFVYTYPERLLHQFNIVDFDYDKDLCETGYLDQYQIILNRLKTHENTNRAVATLYHPGLDKERDDIPCLNWLQVTVRDGKLTLHVMFRSNDLYGAWPANMYFLTYLGLCFAKELFIDFEGIYYHSSSLHIYSANIPEVEELIS